MSGVFFDDPARQALLLAEAKSWLGTRFIHLASVKGGGVDCVQLVGQLMTACGVISGYKFPDYTLDWSQGNSRSIIVDYIQQTGRFCLVENEAPRIGDVVCFRIAKAIHHAGVMLGPRVFVHALAGSVVSPGTIDDPTWAKRLAATYRANL